MRLVHLCDAGGYLDAVFQLFDALDLANMLPALRNSSSTPRAEASSAIPMRRADPVMSILPGNENAKSDPVCFLLTQKRIGTDLPYQLRATVRKR